MQKKAYVATLIRAFVAIGATISCSYQLLKLLLQVNLAPQLVKHWIALLYLCSGAQPKICIALCMLGSGAQPILHKQRYS